MHWSQHQFLNVYDIAFVYTKRPSFKTAQYHHDQFWLITFESKLPMII